MKARSWILALATIGAFGGGLAATVAPASAYLGHKHLFKLQGSFNEITGVAVGAGGISYVSDQNTGLVQKFGPSGEPLDFSGSGAHALEGLSLPQTVATDVSTGAIYVLAGGAVDVFSGAGEPQFQIMPPGGSFSAQFVDVAVNSTTHEVYVSDAAQHFVDVFNAAGEYQRQLALGVEIPPGGVSVDDATGKVYVLAAGNVLVFSAVGVLEETWTAESTAGHLLSPQRITVDQSTGHVYVSVQSPSTSVDEFSATGEFLSELTGVEGRSLANLSAIAVDPSSGNLYIAAENSSGGKQVDVFGPDVVLPDVTTGPPMATSLTATSVTLTGEVNPLGLPLRSCGFTSGAPTASPCSPLPAGSSPVPVSTSLTGLEPNTTYRYQLEAENENGTNFGKIEEFKTPTAKPAIVEASTSYVGPHEALLSTTVNRENSDTTYQFVYGPTSRYGSSLPAAEVDLGSGVPVVRTVQSLTGLQPGSTYHYAVIATNSAGTTHGPDQTFTTPAGPVPGAATGGLSSLSQQSATVQGEVDPEGVPTTYEFDLGTDTSYGTRVFGSAGLGSAPEAFSAVFQSLSPSTTYHYRLVAINGYGTAYGADRTFTTPGFTSALPPAPTALPLVAIPNVAFPSETGTTTTTTKKKALTNAQKLAAALKGCRGQEFGFERRKACEKRERKKYATKKKANRAKGAPGRASGKGAK